MTAGKPIFILIGAALAVFTGIFLYAPTPERQERLTPLTEVPVALQGDEIGNMLRKWYAEGTAAGNTGDYYDNRDGGHSLLNMAPYPQLQKVEYSETQIKGRENWGMQQRILPFVVFGNSSTSAAPEQGGSNIRGYYTSPQGLAFLFAQYAANNLYIYPEHQDHDPGRNGVGGYGDLFPTNTPYLIASQGSSGSDQPFMMAMPATLAAFRPDVKKKLIQSGLLVPTIQMILRATANRLDSRKDYLTGKAHPTVFQGSDVNVQGMVEMAHGIMLSNLPPIALIKAVREDTPVNGVDYFEPSSTEKLADTPAVVARIFRGSGYSRRITVSAESSRDLNNRPLRFHWSVLRGDPAHVKIEYLNASQSAADITISYPTRSPVAGSPGLESNRVDIGIFVHNGAYYSPPAFLTFYSIDSEARTYGIDGRPLEIGYGAGTGHVSVSNWQSLFDILERRPDCSPCEILRRRFKPEESAALSGTAADFRKQHQAVLEAQAALDKINKNAAPELNLARRTLEEVRRSETQILQRKIQRLDRSALEIVQSALNELLRDPDLWHANAQELAASKSGSGALDEIRKKLISFGIAENSEFPVLRLKPAGRTFSSKGSGKPAISPFERSCIEQLNAAILSRILFPGVIDSSWRENYADFRIASIKEWRDVYRYFPGEEPAGWRRFQSDGVRDFNPEGLLVVEKDAQGRCTRGQVVRYELEPDMQDPGGRRNKVKWVPTTVYRQYQYSGPDDWKGSTRN